MAPPAPSKPALTAVPARYAKFIAALLGEAIVYVQLYGTTWHLDAALVCIGAALGVLGVPNASKPAGLVTNVPSYTLPRQVTVVPPSTGPLADPPAPGGAG